MWFRRFGMVWSAAAWWQFDEYEKKKSNETICYVSKPYAVCICAVCMCSDRACHCHLIKSHTTPCALCIKTPCFMRAIKEYKSTTVRDTVSTYSRSYNSHTSCIRWIQRTTYFHALQFYFRKFICCRCCWCCGWWWRQRRQFRWKTFENLWWWTMWNNLQLCGTHFSSAVKWRFQSVWQ